MCTFIGILVHGISLGKYGVRYVPPAFRRVATVRYGTFVMTFFLLLDLRAGMHCALYRIPKHVLERKRGQ
jgi:hypothetical protein